MESMLSIPQFCERFSLSRSTVYRLLATGKLRAIKVGKLRRIRGAEADRWLESLDPSESRAA